MPDPGPRPRYCNRCGYDALGVTGPVCPECGWPLDRVISLWRDGAAPWWLIMTIVLAPPTLAMGLIGIDCLDIELLAAPAWWLTARMGLLGCSTLTIAIFIHAGCAAALAWKGSIRHPGERAVCALMILIPSDLAAFVIFAFHFMLRAG